MNPYQVMVHEFHAATGATIGTDPDLRENELRAKLIMEEAVETVAAMGYAVRAYIREEVPTGRHDTYRAIGTFDKRYASPNFVDVVDGLCDLLYVIFGTAVTAGIDLDAYFAEVHRSNMAKLNGPKREDGKQLKPAGWQPPAIAALLDHDINAALAWNAGIPELARTPDVR